MLAPKAKLRLLCFDLENRPLAYWYDGETTSEITAFGWKLVGDSTVHTMLLQPDGTFVVDGDEVVSDTTAYKFFAEQLALVDLIYGHNIRRHDLPILNAGLLRRQLPTLPPLLTSDTSKDIPKKGGVSVSLENLAAMYGLKGKKYTMSQPMWEDANRLTEAGIELARKRVTSDVLLQERLRKKLIALDILKGPRVWRP